MKLTITVTVIFLRARSSSRSSKRREERDVYDSAFVIPPKGQVNLVQKMLVEEMGTATNIKSRVNRQSVLDAIGSAQQRLKLYSKVPPNGLVVYCGSGVDGEREGASNED